jgi:hypothetical protein
VNDGIATESKPTAIATAICELRCRDTTLGGGATSPHTFKCLMIATVGNRPMVLATPEREIANRVVIRNRSAIRSWNGCLPESRDGRCDVSLMGRSTESFHLSTSAISTSRLFSFRDLAAAWMRAGWAKLNHISLTPFSLPAVAVPERACTVKVPRANVPGGQTLPPTRLPDRTLESMPRPRV